MSCGGLIACPGISGPHPFAAINSWSWGEWTCRLSHRDRCPDSYLVNIPGGIPIRPPPAAFFIIFCMSRN